jgi:hypothetical protein
MRCLYGRPIRFHGKLERVDNRTSAQVAADLVNQAIFDLMLLSIKEAGRVRRYFDIGAIGYGTTAAGLEGVESALGGGLAERGIVGAPELADHPRRFEMEQRDTPAPEIRRPIWIEPLSDHRSRVRGV